MSEAETTAVPPIAPPQTVKVTGTVKWFSDEKGS